MISVNEPAVPANKWAKYLMQKFYNINFLIKQNFESLKELSEVVVAQVHIAKAFGEAFVVADSIPRSGCLTRQSAAFSSATQ